MDGFLDIYRQAGIPVIEDCAQAHGTEYKGQKVGNIGKAGCFSFFATKHMTTGEGGIITTNDAELAETSRAVRSHGMKGRDDHVLLGFNNRMTEMEAAMGLVQLKRLDRLNTKRIENSEYLIKEASKLSWAKVPVLNPDIKHTYFWCPLMVNEDSGKSIEDLKEHLKNNSVGFRHRYQEPLYKQEVLRKLGLDYSGVHLKNVEAITGKILGLPNHPMLTSEELKRIVDVLKTF
jgi:dTDP-4-amino-4,6-dideoxygalactose transaminase